MNLPGSGFGKIKVIRIKACELSYPINPLINPIVVQAILFVAKKGCPGNEQPITHVRREKIYGLRNLSIMVMKPDASTFILTEYFSFSPVKTYKVSSADTSITVLLKV